MRHIACLLLAACVSIAGLPRAAWSSQAEGRIVIEGAGDLRGHLTQLGATLTFPVGKHPAHVVLPHMPVHDVLHVIRRTGVITIELKPGAVVRSSNVGGNLVIDVADPPASRAPTQAAAQPGAPASAPTATAGTDTLIPGLPSGMMASIIGARITTKSVPGTPPPGVRSGVPVDKPASPSPPNGSGSLQPLSIPAASAMAPVDGCLLLPVKGSAGIAAYRRGAETIIIVDQSPVFSTEGTGSWWQAHKPQVTRTADWTAIRVPTARGEGIRIDRQAGGLCLSGTPTLPPPVSTLFYRAEQGALLFSLPHPGRALTVVDPVTHALLLVGTDAGAAGALRPARRSALLAIDESLAGVVVEPSSDRLALHRNSDGYDLGMDGGASIHVAAGFADTAIASVDGLTRTLSLFDAPTSTLALRLQHRALAAAAAPLRARSERRLDLAEAMVALGLGSEARSVLLTATSDDPEAEASPRTALLMAMASIMDKRRRDADPFASPHYPDTEEGKLWQALAWSPPAPLGPAVVTIRRGMPLLLSYPAQLRNLAAREAARVLLASDDPDALRAIDLLPGTENVRLARAEADAKLGHRAEAIAAIDPLTRSRDLAVMAASLRDTIRLRLAAAQLTPAAAADLLDAHRLDWRLVGQEGGALLEEGDDRARVPDLRAAFALWQDAAGADPALREEVGSRRLAALGRLSEPDLAGRVGASDYASIIAENADAIPPGSDLAARLGMILADKFASLGLDDHAATTLEPLVRAMPAGLARASINTQIAALDVARETPEAAADVLSRDDEATLPAALLGRRHLLRARVLDAGGKSADALALLADAKDDEALQLEAKLMMERQDWHGAVGPLSQLFGRLPERGSLDAAQGAVALQFVAASVRDGASLTAAAKAIGPRLEDASERRSYEILMAPLPPAAAGTVSGI